MGKPTNPTTLDRLFADWQQALDDIIGCGEKLITIDLHEHDDYFVIAADLPGITDETLSLSVTRTTIRITVPHTTRLHHCQQQLLLERHQGSFSRRISLPHPVQTDEFVHELVDGVLTVKLYKIAHDGHSIQLSEQEERV